MKSHDENEKIKPSIRASTTYMLICCCMASFSVGPTLSLVITMLSELPMLISNSQDTFAYAVLPPILPFVLPSRAQVPADQVQRWVALLPTLTAIATIAASPLAGWLGDRLDRRKPLFIGAIIVQWAGISLIMIGTHLGLWISGVVLYGAASAIVWSTSLALIIDRAPVEQLGQMLSFTGLSLSIGVLLGPALGGIIYERAGHYAVWSTVLGVTVLDFLLRIFLIESPRVKVSSGGSNLTASPLIALQLLRSPRMLVALFGACIQAAILTSFDSSLTIYVAQTFHWGSLQAGLLWLAFCVPAFASPLVGMLGDKCGVRPVMAAAFLGAAPVLAAMQFVDSDSTGDKVLLCFLLALLGSLLGTSISLFSAEVSHVVHAMADQRPGMWGEHGVIAQAEATWWAFYMLGMAIGPLIGGFVHGWPALNWTLAALSMAASVLVIIFLKPRCKRRIM